MQRTRAAMFYRRTQNHEAVRLPPWLQQTSEPCSLPWNKS